MRPLTPGEIAIVKEALTLHVVALGKRAKAYRMTYSNPTHPKAAEADAQAETLLALIEELS